MVHEFSATADRAVSAMLKLDPAHRQRKSTPNELVPKELEQLGDQLTRYYAVPLTTRALLLDGFFSIWETIESRFTWVCTMSTRIGCLVHLSK